MRSKGSYIIPMGLVAASLAAYSCNKGKSDPKDTVTPVAAPATDTSTATQGVDPGAQGVTEASGDNLGVAGTLALDLNLNNVNKPNKVLVWVFDDHGFEKTGTELSPIS